jgi:hypothetical protein
MPKQNTNGYLIPNKNIEAIAARETAKTIRAVACCGAQGAGANTPKQGWPFTTEPHRGVRPASPQEHGRLGRLAAAMPPKEAVSGQTVGADDCSSWPWTLTCFPPRRRRTMCKHNSKTDKILTFGSAHHNSQSQSPLGPPRSISRSARRSTQTPANPRHSSQCRCRTARLPRQGMLFIDQCSLSSTEWSDSV